MTEERITRQKELIYELMGDCMYMPMKEKELASLLILNKAQRKELSRVLKELLEEKKIICGSDGRYQRAKKAQKNHHCRSAEKRGFNRGRAGFGDEEGIGGSLP